jgi:hypothetical protein
MPDGVELYTIARDVLKSLAKQQIASWYPDLLPKNKALEPLDPTSASLVMASRFIPYITSYIQDGGKVAVAEIGQQLADDWLVMAPEVIDAARTAALDLCEETVQTFTRDLNTTLEGIRGDIAASIQSGETAGDTVNRVAKWVDENSRWRARRIAVTESARAYNQGQVAATQSYDFVAGYELLLSSDACPLCHAIHRQCPKIPKGGSFGQNGNNKTYKDLKFPPFHPNCRCTLVTVFDDEVPDRWPAPVQPADNGYITPNENDYENAADGGYESVSIGNAKSLKSFITLTEVDNGQV